MKNISLLSTAIVMALTGCGGDNSSNTPSTSTSTSTLTPSTFTVTAIDGYLSSANVYAGEDCLDKIGTTNAKGQVKIDNKHKDLKICIKAIQGQTIDATRGPVQHSFELKAPAGYDVVSPMTDLVVEQMKKGATQEQAEEKVVVAVSAVWGGEVVSKDILFGDFVAKTSTQAEAIEIMSETLVDKAGNGLAVEQQLKVTKELSEDISDKTRQGKDLKDYAPVVSVNTDGSVTIEENYRPAFDQGNLPEKKNVVVVDGAHQGITPIDISRWFHDADKQNLTYSIESYRDGKLDKSNTFKLEDNQITGTVKKAGLYEIHVFASDSHEVRSDSVIITIEATTANTAPTLNTNIADAVQESLNKLEIYANDEDEIEKEISIAGLFTDQSDVLTYTVSHETRAKIEIQGEPDNETLTISGKFNTGEKTITISAEDGINRPVTKEFTLTIGEASNGGEQVSNRLKSFLVDDGLPEYFASMNATQSIQDTQKNGGDIEYRDPSYLYDNAEVQIKGNTLVIFENGERTIDEFLYIGSNLAVAYPHKTKDLVIWSHDDIRNENTHYDHIFNNNQALTIPDRLKSGTWYRIEDSAGNNSAPRMKMSKLKMEFNQCEAKSTGTFEEYPLEVTFYSGNSITYRVRRSNFGAGEIETCRILSMDEQLIVMSCAWENTDEEELGINYRLFTQDRRLAETLYNRGNK